MAASTATATVPGLTVQELDELYKFAVQLGKDAGDKLMEDAKARWGGGSGSNNHSQQEMREKENAVDIVTKTDEEVEAFIKGRIFDRYPDHEFIGEETYSAGSSRQYLVSSSTTTLPTWIVDPLDGTVNYTHNFPMFCVSIGIVVCSVPIIGVIYAPFTDQLFTSCKGKGAWLNETQSLPLVKGAPLPESAPKGCIFSCEWGKDRRDIKDGNMHRKVESFVNMAAEVGGREGKGGMVHGVRSLGSATLDLAYTAMGAFDIWWEGGCWEWIHPPMTPTAYTLWKQASKDVAAGIAILLEAGGLVTTANPPENWETAEVQDVGLGSRLYLAIRPAGDTDKVTKRQAQERVVREVWKRVRELDYARPGA
ncbi:hypothetical protein MKZ38_005973 [Zalerion maritima]|uniref:Inositol-1-monophosphatase n=1 Tax=Zalerion maritima TaxID=339359 RepID=A0AAD5RKD2_9PEZI|nr:hypothetical protein MKZ38_005973 [Zalerion maritima]